MWSDDPRQPGKTVYYLKIHDQSLSTLNQFAIVKVVAQMNNGWGIYPAYPTYSNTTIPTGNGKSQFPDWMGNYAEFAGQVSGPKG